MAQQKVQTLLCTKLLKNLPLWKAVPYSMAHLQCLEQEGLQLFGVCSYLHKCLVIF